MTLLIVLGAVFSIAVIALLVYGIVTHRDRNDALGMQNILVWKRDWPPLTLIVDTDLVDVEEKILEAVKAGARVWNDAALLELFVGADNIRREGHVIPIMPAPMDTDEHEHAIAYTRYTLDADGAMQSAAVYLMPGWESFDKDIFHRAITHELGHCLGLAHDGIRDSVMYSAAVPEKFVVTKKDAAYLESIYG